MPLPFAAAAAYLFVRAAPQYHSEVAFSVRSEEVASATAGLLGALTQIGSGSAPDAAILYEYIRSQEIVAAVDARLDLRAIWNRPGSGWRDGDPVFTLGDDRGDRGAAPPVAADGHGLLRHRRRDHRRHRPRLHARGRAGDRRGDPRPVERAGERRSPSRRARTRCASPARSSPRPRRTSPRCAPALAAFRREHSLVDPSADVAGQSGLLNALNAELAQALVDRDVLTSYAGEGDQRVVQADRRIAAITERIEDERATLGVTGVAGTLPELVGRYEELAVDLEFANTAYTQTLAGLAAARAEARRQSRYLAPHVRPTLATTSLYPRRFLLAGLTGLFLLLGWGIADARLLQRARQPLSPPQSAAAGCSGPGPAGPGARRAPAPRRRARRGSRPRAGAWPRRARRRAARSR